MVKLETDKLLLRQLTRDDLDELGLISANPKTRGFLWEGPTDREATASHLEAWTEEYRRGLGHLAMIHKPDGQLVGHCGLTERDGRVFLSYALRKEHWCKGLAPEACRAMLSYGFKELGLREIWTGTRAENRAWQGMMEKLGMTLRETERAGYGEEVRYAALREEFFGIPATKG